MTNPLIDARDAFSEKHPEQRLQLNGRDWGYWDVGAASRRSFGQIMVLSSLLRPCRTGPEMHQG